MEHKVTSVTCLDSYCKEVREIPRVKPKEITTRTFHLLMFKSGSNLTQKVDFAASTQRGGLPFIRRHLSYAMPLLEHIQINTASAKNWHYGFIQQKISKAYERYQKHQLDSINFNEHPFTQLCFFSFP